MRIIIIDSFGGNIATSSLRIYSKCEHTGVCLGNVQEHTHARAGVAAQKCHCQRRARSLLSS